MIQHPFHIFDCLRTLNNIMFPPVRDFTLSDKLLHINELTFGRYGKICKDTKNAAWLEVTRPDFTSFPQIPGELASWVGDWGGQLPNQPPRVKRYYRNKEEFWEDKRGAFSAKEDSSLKGERFEADPKRVKSWRHWLSAEWLPWAKDNLEKFNALECYERVWLLVQEFENRSDHYELLWCSAILSWRVDGVEIKRPLLVNRLEVGYDPALGVLRFFPVRTGLRLEYDMLFGVPGVNFPALFLLERQLLDEGLELLDNSKVRGFCQKLADAVAPGCQVLAADTVQGKAAGGQPRIYCGNHVIALSRLDASKWRGELEGIVDTIDGGGLLPELFNHYYRQEKRGQEMPERSWKETGQTQLFPWPACGMQKEVVRRLADNPLVLVETPENSNKEHILANLVAHLLAHGKKVLLTGASSQSLWKTGDLINNEFTEIAPLCTCVTGTDRENTAELLSSLRAHNQKMNFFTREEVARNLAELQTRLGHCRNELAEDKKQLQAAQSLEYSRRFNIDGKDKTPWEVAAWLAETKDKFGYILDNIGHDQECPLSGEELEKFFALLGKMSPEDAKRLNLWWPPQEKVMDAGRLRALLEQLEALYPDRNLREELLADCIYEYTDIVNVRGIQSEYQKALAALPGAPGEWLESVLKDLGGSVQKRRMWEDLYQSSLGRIQKISSLEKTLNDYTISIPEGKDFQLLKDDLYNLRTEFYKNGRLSMLFKWTSGKSVINNLQDCWINAKAPTTLQEVELLLAYIDRDDESMKLANKWNNVVFEIGGPRLDETAPDFLENLEKYIGQLRQVISWYHNHFEVLQKSWGIFRHNQAPQWTDRFWLGGMLPKLQAWYQESSIGELLAELDGQRGVLETVDKGEKAHPVCGTLRAALEERDLTGWREARETIGELSRQRKVWEEFRSLYMRLADVAPLWVEELFKSAQRSEAVMPESWKEAWLWARCKTWLRKHREGNKLLDMHGQFAEKQSQEKLLAREVAASSAWYWQLKRITAEERRGLDFLLNKADQKYGSDINEELPHEFLREAEFWRMSMPAWIMPVDVLLTTAGPFDRTFDVVIVDSSEKMDIFSLCLLLRGKKAIIVGDNMLPSGISLGEGRVPAAMVLEKSLLGLPAKVRFELHDSLYDFAQRLLDGQSVLINETYAYLPGVSEFANKYFYGGKLNQLERELESLALKPALNKVLLPPQLTGSSNRQEAAAMIDKVAEAATRSEYTGKSMCVLTLGDSEQVTFLSELLLQKLSEEEIVAHDIGVSVIGDYSGGARDIVFVGLVSAQLAEKADMREINAAVSLAKEQLHVFQPFAADNIFARSFSGRLLAVESVKAESGNAEICRLNTDICRAAVHKGYRAFAGYSPAGFDCRIDVAIASAGGRVAIFCDGLRSSTELDRMFAKEEQLTRVGWHVYHVRGCDFYADQGKLLDRLWQFIEKVGIMTVQEEQYFRKR